MTGGVYPRNSFSLKHVSHTWIFCWADFIGLVIRPIIRWPGRVLGSAHADP